MGKYILSDEAIERNSEGEINQAQSSLKEEKKEKEEIKSEPKKIEEPKVPAKKEIISADKMNLEELKERSNNLFGPLFVIENIFPHRLRKFVVEFLLVGFILLFSAAFT